MSDTTRSLFSRPIIGAHEHVGKPYLQLSPLANLLLMSLLMAMTLIPIVIPYFRRDNKQNMGTLVSILILFVIPITLAYSSWSKARDHGLTVTWSKWT